MPYIRQNNLIILKYEKACTVIWNLENIMADFGIIKGQGKVLEVDKIDF